MAHESIENLRDGIHAASSLVEVGGHYVHYKNRHTYAVLGFVVLESTDEIAVRYAEINDPHVEFVRPLSSWTATIEGNPRFTPESSTD